MRNLPLLAAVVMLSAAAPPSDVSLSYIEYRVLQPVGQVRITTGLVHDREVQSRMLGRLASLDREGIILIAGNSIRQFRRNERIGGHSVQTAIIIYPAVGHGYRGGLATAHLTITVDGKKKMDSAYDAGPVELDDVDVMPLENLIYIVGSYNYRPVEGTVPLGNGETINDDWLVRHTRPGGPDVGH